jgi:hypothetical protein
MAEDVQRLLLQIDASTTLLRQQLTAGEKAIDRFASTTERQTQRASASIEFMGGAMKGFISVLSVGAIASFSSKILNFADDLATAADQAGISVERFQTLRDALRSLEVGAEQQQKIFQKLLTTLGDVQGGTAAKGTVEVLDRMGITSRILNGEISTTDGLLDAIAQTAGRYTTQARFAADVSALVGQKMGPQLAAALADGGIALKNAEDNFRKTGAVIDETMIKKLADANESIDAFATQSKNRLTIWAGETITLLQRLGVAFDNITGKQDTSTRSGTITALMKARETRENLEAGTFGFIPVAPQAIANARARERELQNLLRQQEMENPALTDPMSRLFPLNASGRFGTGPMIGMKTTAKKTKKSKETKDFTAANMESGFELRQLLDAGTPANIELTNEALQGVAETMRDLQQYDFSLDLVDRQQIELAQAYTETLTTGLAQAIVYGRSFGDVLKGLAAQILSAGLLNIISGGAYGVAFGSSLGGLGKVFGGARANGGPVSMGNAYLVGERGPELFVPNSSGYINANKSNGGTGGEQQVRVMVEPSPLFVTTVVQGATAAAGEQMRKAARPRMMMSAGA